MPPSPPDVSLPPHRPGWKWWICGLLLLATMLNYMDRLTLNLTSKQIMGEFGLDESDYAQLESAFAFAFALGAIFFGWLADRWSVRWLYPAAVLAWSFAGLSTGPHGEPTTASAMLAAVGAANGAVDGYWLNIPSPGPYCRRCGRQRTDIGIQTLLSLP